MRKGVITEISFSNVPIAPITCGTNPLPYTYLTSCFLRLFQLILHVSWKTEIFQIKKFETETGANGLEMFSDGPHTDKESVAPSADLTTTRT